MSGSRGGEAGGSDPPPPLKNHKNIGFPSNIDLDPLKSTKLPNQQSGGGYIMWFGAIMADRRNKNAFKFVLQVLILSKKKKLLGIYNMVWVV